MEHDFEILIASFIENKIGISNDFLSKELSNHLKKHLLQLYQDNSFAAAGIGNKTKLLHNVHVRNDCIYWLDRIHNNPYENEFFNLIEEFIKYLNMNCYTGITDFEFHFSLYEKGNFYKKHKDQFDDNSSRKYSMISYLNEDWEEKDGGQLLIYHEGHEEMISPQNGKTVLFKSDALIHEVLITHKRRMSVTGWLKIN